MLFVFVFWANYFCVIFDGFSSSVSKKITFCFYFCYECVDMKQGQGPGYFLKQYRCLYVNKLRITNFTISKNHCSYFKHNLSIEIQIHTNKSSWVPRYTFPWQLPKKNAPKSEILQKLMIKNQESLNKKLVQNSYRKNLCFHKTVREAPLCEIVYMSFYKMY